MMGVMKARRMVRMLKSMLLFPSSIAIGGEDRWKYELVGRARSVGEIRGND